MSEQSIERIAFHHEKEFPMGLLSRHRGAGLTVAELLPPNFSRYLRIFHPFHPADVSDPEEQGAAVRTWQSLAEEAGVVFHPELVSESLVPALPEFDRERWPWWVDEGRLNNPARRALYGLLARHSGQTDAYFLYYLAPIVRAREPLLFRAAIPAIEAVQTAAQSELDTTWLESPEFVWPVDRAWVLNTDIDLVSTYVASGHELADAIVAEPALETLEVTLESRVDRKADRINRPHERKR